MSQDVPLYVPADGGPSYRGQGDRYTFLVTGAQSGGATRSGIVKSLKKTALVPFAALLVALITLLAAPAPTFAASGTIVDIRFTATSIDPSTSLATLRGTIQCSAPTSVTVYGAVYQSKGANYNRIAQYFGATDMSCGTAPTEFQVTVTPGYESVRLTPGDASIGVWVEHCDQAGCFGRGYSESARKLVVSG